MIESVVVVGLGVMGRNLAANLIDRGYRVRAYDPWAQARSAARSELPAGIVVDDAGALRSGRPRLFWLLVKAGEPTDAALGEVAPLLGTGDVVADGGNAHYRDTERRARALSDDGVGFLGLGVSGGAEGARRGPSLMAGGDRGAFERARVVLSSVAATGAAGPCAGYFGAGGAGHFVKMVHNGIEYAEMQLLAEIHQYLRRVHGLDARAAADVFAAIGEGLAGAFLVDATVAVLRATTPDGGALVDAIEDAAGQKGTGRWAVDAAMELGVAAPTLSAAVSARALSGAPARGDVRERLGAVIGAAPVGAAGSVDVRALADAWLAGRIAAYGQGFAMLEAAREWWCELEPALAAAVWQGGCILRSPLLPVLHGALTDGPSAPHLLAAPSLAELLSGCLGGLRSLVARSVNAGLPAPAASASLAYVDAWRSARVGADLIQGQRDYFGAHGFRLAGRPGTHSHPWRR